jgi:hypothetical protein
MGNVFPLADVFNLVPRIIMARTVRLSVHVRTVASAILWVGLVPAPIQDSREHTAKTDVSNDILYHMPRFCEKPSQNHIWDKEVENNHSKTLDNLVIYRLNIIETDFILG